MKLDHLAYIRVKGADAAGFLQGQLSNDVRLLSTARAQISSCNSPKGRMLAVLHLFREDEDILLEVHRSVSASVLKRLRLYVLRSKVAFEEGHPGLGLVGNDTTDVLAKLDLPCPAQSLDMQIEDGVRIVRRIGAQARFSLHAEPARLAEFTTQIAALLPQGDENDWKRADIEAGVPTIYPQTQDRFVPQWCNLDQLGGISFDKGCYTGQEIVARVHYLGEVKRRMKPAHLADCTTLSPGAQTEHGEIVEVVALAEGGCLGLVVQKS